MVRAIVIAGSVLAPFAAHVVLAHGNDVPLWPAQASSALQAGVIAWIGCATLTRAGRRVRWLVASLAATTLLIATDLAARSSLIVAAGLSHGAFYLGIGLLFGLSLRPGREALVSRLARRVEPCPTRALIAYTRGVTWLWAGFGAAQLAVSALLLATAPLPVWSLFVNVLDVPLVVLTFAAEYAVRRWRFRHMRLASLASTVAAFARRDTIERGAAPIVSPP